MSNRNDDNQIIDQNIPLTTLLFPLKILKPLLVTLNIAYIEPATRIPHKASSEFLFGKVRPTNA